jgi:plasmid replication initiation protein
MNKQIMLKESNKYVVKSNSLVEARYRLSLQESKIILWLLTQIRHDDEDFKSHQMTISEFSKMIGVEVDNQYGKIREVTKSLMRRVLEIYEPEKNSFLQVSWLSSARYEGKKGIVSLEFSPQLKPYLLKLKSHFTKLDISTR